MKHALALFGITCSLIAHTQTVTIQPPLWDQKWHDINAIRIGITNYGRFGWMEWPIGTNHNYLSGAGLWFGAIDSVTGDTLVTIGYPGQSEFAPGLRTQDPNSPVAIIYMYPDEWPAPKDSFPMAPQEAISNQDSWCCYNDCDSVYHAPGNTRPLGIEVYQTGYAWTSPLDIVFMTLEMKNVTGNCLKDCYIGLFTDCDIGNEAAPNQNDLASAIIGRWYVIDGESLWVDDVGYQWQEESEPGWEEFPGVICFDLLQTPFDLQVGEDKDGDGIPDQYEQDSAYYVNNLPPKLWDVDMDNVPDWRDPSQWPQLGMTSFKRWPSIPPPVTDAERYLTLAGYNYLTGEYEPYDTAATQPDDQMFLMSSGPFNLAPDSSVVVIFAITCAYWEGIFEAPDTALVDIDQAAEDYYNMYWYLYTGVEEFSIEELSPLRLNVQPNPVTHHAKVTFSLCESGNVSMRMYDIQGRLNKNIVQEYKTAGIHEIDIATEGFSQGMYFLVVETPRHKQSLPIVIIR